MSETLVNTIDGDKLYAERAVKDASGNSISETYATKSEIPVVDQSYDATSTNAQSGVAVAEALSNVPSPLSAGNGIDIYNNVISAKADGSSITYNSDGELEAHNTLIAGGGIDINPYNVIAAKADGSSITYNANGELEAHNTLIAGGGIDINPYNVIAAKADGSSITYNSDGELEAHNTLTGGNGIDIDTNNDTISVKTDGSTISFNASGELQATVSGGVTDVTVDGTSVVNAQGVAEITMPTFTQVQSDWSQSDNTQVDYIKNKPSLATVATSGDYDDLTNKPSIPAAQVNSDWNASSGVAEILNKPTLATVATTGAYSDLSGTPTLATVATSGDYDDLSNKPSIPAAQVNSDWNASSGVAEILNKPTLATVATTGAYSDLSGTPTIPAAQVNSDWNASSGVAEILNKPALATVATSGSYNDLSDKPTIPTMELFEAVYGTTTYAAITSAIAAKKIVYCRISPSGATRMAFLAYIGSNNVEFQYYRSLSSRSATNQLDEVYVYTVSSSGWTTTTRKAGVLIAAGTGLTSSYASGTLTINGKNTDQTYDATSTNPQSGVAVAGALAGKEDAFTVGDGLEMVTSGNTRTLQVEAPVDIVAGPGIVIDNPDGNTLRVSQQYPTDETVLWEKSDTAANNTNFSASLSETVAHFKKIKIYAAPNSSYLTQRLAREYIFDVANSATQFCYVDTHSIESGVYYGEIIYVYINNYTTFQLSAGIRWQDSTITKNIATYRGEILKISGVQRIASN